MLSKEEEVRMRCLEVASKHNVHHEAQIQKAGFLYDFVIQKPAAQEAQRSSSHVKEMKHDAKAETAKILE